MLSMLSSFRSIPALGAAPVYADPPVLVGATVWAASAVVRPAWNPVLLATEAPAAVTSVTASLSEAIVAATAGAGAAAMAA